MLDNVNKNYRPEFGSTTANFGMTTQQGGNQAHPAMQAEINKERIKDAANDNYIANRVNAFSEVDPTLQMGVALPVWLVMNQAMDRYLKACGGEYSKSIPGRIGNFGDKITDFLTNNPVAKGINKVLNKGQRFAKRNIYDNSALLRAFDRTPSQPELTLVKHQFAGDLGMIANDITNPCDAFLESVKSAKDLDCLGASKADIQRVEGLLKKAATAEEKRLILQAEEFRLLSPDKSSKAIRAFKYNANEKVKAKILKDLKIKAMGFKDAAEYELLKSDPIKYHEKLIEVFKKANKKIVLVNFSGSAMALTKEAQLCDAILQAWYPGQAGGKAIAATLMGEYNPAGRLPLTFYKSTSQLPDFEDYSLKGRTYRYFTDEPLFPFGHGLSYTSFKYGEAELSSRTIKAGENLSMSIPVSNIGKYDGDEVVQIYIRRPDDKQGPLLTLREFKRVNIAKGTTSNIKFQLTPDSFEWFDTNTNTMRTLKGEYEILYGGTSDMKKLKSVKITITE